MWVRCCGEWRLSPVRKRGWDIAILNGMCTRPTRSLSDRSHRDRNEITHTDLQNGFTLTKFCVNCAVANLGIGMGVFLLLSDASDLGGCVRLGGGLTTTTFDWPACLWLICFCSC